MDGFVDLVGRGFGTNTERLEHRETVIGVIQEEFAAELTEYGSIS